MYPKFYYGLLLNELLLQLIITNLRCNFIIVKLSEKHISLNKKHGATKRRCTAHLPMIYFARCVCSTAWKSRTVAPASA